MASDLFWYHRHANHMASIQDIKKIYLFNHRGQFQWRYTWQTLFSLICDNFFHSLTLHCTFKLHVINRFPFHFKRLLVDFEFRLKIKMSQTNTNITSPDKHAQKDDSFNVFLYVESAKYNFAFKLLAGFDKSWSLLKRISVQMQVMVKNNPNHAVSTFEFIPVLILFYNL